MKYIPSFLPGAGFKRSAHKWRTSLDDIVENLWTEGVRVAVSPSFLFPTFSPLNLTDYDLLCTT